MLSGERASFVVALLVLFVWMYGRPCAEYDESGS
jgi:hypothetical protein